MQKNKYVSCVWLVVFVGLCSGCALQAADQGAALSDEQSEMPQELTTEKVVTLTHSIRVGHHRRVVVRESFTRSSFQRSPRRAIVFLNGTPTTGDFFNIPVDGYRGRERLAERGFFAYTLDFEGSGASTYPEDAFGLTFDALTASTRAVVEHIRRSRSVSRVDLLGEAEGGGVAVQLCADDTIIRSCTLSSMLYQNGTDAFRAYFQSPEFRALVLGAPDGYLDIPPPLYFNVLAAAPPDVAAWTLANQPGRYSMGLVAEQLNGTPSYEPTGARVPGLIIRGELDQNAPLQDTQHLAQDYGSEGGAGPATLVSIPGAMMIPRIEAPPHNEQFWDAVVDFVDP
ncbi:MAG: alpha/beta hydrolase [Myxococcaceae bacterium]